MIVHQLAYLLVAALLAVFVLLDGRNLGVGIVHLVLPNNDEERGQALAMLGHGWAGHVVWPIGASAVLSVGFPAAWRALAAGFELPMAVALCLLLVRPLLLRARCQAGSPAWRRRLDQGFSLSSGVPVFLLGLLVGNTLRGFDLGPAGRPAGGELALFNPFSLFVAATTVALFALQGTCWLGLKAEGRLRYRAITAALFAWAAFVALYLDATLWTPSEAPWLFIRHRMSWWAWLPVVPLGLAIMALPLVLRRERMRIAYLCSTTIVACVACVTTTALFPFLIIFRNLPRASLTAYGAAASRSTLTLLLAISVAAAVLLLAGGLALSRRSAGQAKSAAGHPCSPAHEREG
jgi:cytochrome d ubiquinol oxidase subunit II